VTSDGEMLLRLKRPPGARTEVGRLNLAVGSSRRSKLISELDPDPTIASPVRISCAGKEELVDGEGTPETECLMLLVGGTVSI
jgi:hypothetical protein